MIKIPKNRYFLIFVFVNRAETRRHTRAEAKRIKIKMKLGHRTLFFEPLAFQ